MKSRFSLLIIILMFVAIPVGAQAQETTHEFWDRQNKLLFWGGVVARGADTITTRQLMNRGGKEYLLPQSVANSTAKMVAFSVGAQAVSWGLSYLAHRKGWHKLERVLNWANFTVPAGLAANNHLQGR